ncbi:MAG TPA: YihY/virulence factor BrkB family protein [Thermoguttaceae bacterium]|nr:YihY/virulence factor BrkB family protein [Thermoguttaceae bacterium]
MARWFNTRIRQLHQTWLAWRHNEADLTAASMAYYAVLSFFPLLLLLIAVFGFTLRYSVGAQDSQDRLLCVLAENTSPLLADHVQSALAEIQANASIGGPLGLFVLLLAAIGIFTQLDVAMNRIWGTTSRHGRTFLRAVRDALLHRLRAFLILSGLGLLIWAAFVADTVASALRPWVADLHGGHLLWMSGRLAISLVINSVLLMLVYKLLPRTHVWWRAAARGGVLAAVLWEISRQVLGLLLLGNKYTAYGVVGSLMAVMLWIYIASCVFFFAAEYVRVVQRDTSDSENPSNKER